MNNRRTILLLMLFISFSILTTFIFIEKIEANNTYLFSGKITKDISTTYIIREYSNDIDFKTKTNSSFQIFANETKVGLNFSLFSIRTDILNFKSNDTKYVIANNISNITAIEKTPIFGYAQQFILARPMYINYLGIYVNNSGNKNNLKILLDFYRNLTQSPINLWQLSTNVPAHYIGWYNISVNLYFRPGSYFFTLSFTGGVGVPLNTNYILLQNNISKNNGLTEYNNGTWIVIEHDNTRDILSQIYGNYYFYPYQLNMSLMINNQSVPLDILESPWEMRIENFYYLPEKPGSTINISFSINKTNYFGSIQIEMRYFGRVNATGTFKVSSSAITSNIKYFVNSSISWDYYLLYPGYWNLYELYDNFENKMEEYFIGKFKIYGNEYWGIANFMMMGDGIYTANFTIPNFLSEVNLQIYENNFFPSSSIEIGQNFRVHAILKDTSGNSMNGGFCNITIIRPNGKIISVNSTVINGNLTSNLISTSGWKEGTGSITIFWTDGSAFGYSKFSFSMIKISFPWAILLSIIIGIIITVPTSLYVLRKLEERNWEKSLLYIFGLTKEGGSLFGKTFRIDLQDPALISGMIAAITNFVTETMKSKKALRVIDHEDKKVILSHGPNYIIALMAEKDLNIIRNRLDKFSSEFGELYGNKIKTWRGETKVFKGVDTLIEKYFPLSVEQKLKLGVGTKLKEFKEILATSEDQKEIISILKEISSMALRYKEIIKSYFQKEYDDLLKIADEKINSE